MFSAMGQLAGRLGDVELNLKAHFEIGIWHAWFQSAIGSRIRSPGTFLLYIHT